MTTMSGDIGRAYRRNLNFGVKGLVANVGDPTTRPAQGLDRLWLKWWKGVGAAIVVGDGERPLRGEGLQGLERDLRVRSQWSNPKEHSVDVWMIFAKHKRVSPEKRKRNQNTGLGICTI